MNPGQDGVWLQQKEYSLCEKRSRDQASHESRTVFRYEKRKEKQWENIPIWDHNQLHGIPQHAPQAFYGGHVRRFPCPEG